MMEDLLTHTNDLIQRGQLQKAQRRLEDEHNNTAIQQCAEYWRQRLLISLINGYEQGTERHTQRGRVCRDWDNPYEAEVHLEAARYLLRQARRFRIVTPQHEARLRQATDSIETAEKLLDAELVSYVYTGEILALKGQLAYVQQDYESASGLHEAAAVYLIGERRHTNRLDLLKAMRCASPGLRNMPSSVLKRIAEEDFNRGRRYAAAIIALTGGFGCWLHDRLAAV